MSIVLVGSFNPAIFHPWWFADRELLPSNVIEAALKEDFVTVKELSRFNAEWLGLQARPNQLVFSTVEEARSPDLRDLVVSVLDLLPETPVDAVGLNSDAHFRVESVDEWHNIGDRFLPKDFWEPLFEDDIWEPRPDGQRVGLRSMKVEATRKEPHGYVRTEVAPSARIKPHGVYVGINAHFQLRADDKSSNGFAAARTIEEHWDETRQLEVDLTRRVLEKA